MQHRLTRTLQRRERMLHVRRLQEETAQQALAVLLKNEDALKRERDALEHARDDAHETMLDEMGQGVRSESLIPYVRRINAMEALAEAKDGEIVAMQPRIQEGREEVILRYRARRAMEILKEKAATNLLQEELRTEQRSLDELTTQRHANRNRDSNL